MTKEYLKMADMFPFDVGFNSDGGIGAVVDSQGGYIAQAMENNYCSHMSNKDKNEYRNKVARYVAHSVASHDELVAEVERLREFERDALRYHWLMQNTKLGIGRNGKDWDLQIDGSAPDAISEISAWIDNRMG